MRNAVDVVVEELEVWLFNGLAELKLEE